MLRSLKYIFFKRRISNILSLALKRWEKSLHRMTVKIYTGHSTCLWGGSGVPRRRGGRQSFLLSPFAPFEFTYMEIIMYFCIM